MSEQSPERRERIENVVRGEIAVDAVAQHLVHGHDPAQHVVVLVPAHQVEIGGRQDRHRDTDVGEAPGDALELRNLQSRELGHVTHGDAPAVAVLLGAVAHVLDGHALGRVAEVEVHVDVDVELARHLEEPVDLPRRVAVGVGRAARRHGSPASDPRS